MNQLFAVILHLQGYICSTGRSATENLVSRAVPETSYCNILNIIYYPCSLLQYTPFITPTTAHNLFSYVPPTCFGCYFQPSPGSQHQSHHKYAFQLETHACDNDSVVMNVRLASHDKTAAVWTNLMLTPWRWLEVTAETCRRNTREEIVCSSLHNKKCIFLLQV
jgi:hypothetical protein